MVRAAKARVLSPYALDCILSLAKKYLFENLNGLGVKKIFIISLKHSSEIPHINLNVLVPTLKIILSLMGSQRWSCNTGEMWSSFLVLVTIFVA